MLQVPDASPEQYHIDVGFGKSYWPTFSAYQPLIIVINSGLVFSISDPCPALSYNKNWLLSLPDN